MTADDLTTPYTKTEYVALPDYSAALDETYRLRCELAYEARPDLRR